VKGKTIVVTGANSGIGLETATALAAKGARVVMTARDPAKGEAALRAVIAHVPKADVHLLLLDLASFSSVRSAASSFLGRFDRLDVLVNNAGLIYDRRTLTEDGNEMTFQVNHLGPFLFTNLLLEALKACAPSRIVNVSSMTHRGGAIDFDDLRSEASFGAMRAYSNSKLCNILFTRELARRLTGTTVTANSLHPGSVRTGFSGGGDTRLLSIGWKLASPFLISAKRGAKTSVYLASSPEVEGVSGGYFVRSKPSKPSAAGRDDDVARRLWDVSEGLVGLRQTA
jgi:retinol dehydrogenase 12